MPADKAAQAFLEELARAGVKPLNEISPQEAREQMLLGNESLPPGTDVLSVSDREIGDGVPVRVYRPASGTLPAVIFFHGGGWVIGDIETHDAHCRDLANKLGAVVVSVHYRLAPEHRYPAAAEDCYAATKWTADESALLDIDPQQIIVMGDSAGGNLAGVVALMARDRQGPAIAGQVLVYPITDYPLNTPSYDEYATGHLLTRDAMQWFWDQYVPDESQRQEPYASPLRSDDLAGLPRALVFTAECDPLRDEGEAYAERLLAAGNKCQLIRYDGAIHGFIRHPHRFQQAVDYVERVKDFLSS